MMFDLRRVRLREQLGDESRCQVDVPNTDAPKTLARRCAGQARDPLEVEADDQPRRRERRVDDGIRLVEARSGQRPRNRDHARSTRKPAREDLTCGRVVDRGVRIRRLAATAQQWLPTGDGGRDEFVTCESPVLGCEFAGRIDRVELDRDRDPVRPRPRGKWRGRDTTLIGVRFPLRPSVFILRACLEGPRRSSTSGSRRCRPLLAAPAARSRARSTALR